MGSYILYTGVLGFFTGKTIKFMNCRLLTDLIATVSIPNCGVVAGQTLPKGRLLDLVFRNILAPYVVPSMSGLAITLNPNDSYIEVGHTVDVISAAWIAINDSDGKPPANMYLTGDGFNKAVSGISSTANPASTTQLVAPGSKTWTLSGEDKNAVPITPATYLKAWRFKYWLGATSAVNPTDDITATALALALQQSQLLTSRSANFTCTVDNDTTGNYTWIAYPASYGALTGIIQNEALPVLGAFTYIGSWNVTNAYGIIESYRFYKSNADKAFANGTTLAIS